MDYEKKYKEALEIAEKILRRGYYISGDIEAIFPELKESEDERIRKVLVGFFKSYKEQGTCGAETFNGIPTENILEWIKKQGEQKSTWTDDDEKIINTIINEFEQCSFRCCSNGLRKEDCIAWLNKIKHIEWVEWNDKDKEKLNSLYIYLDQMLSFNMVSNKDVTELKNWLKLLKDRVQPRPKQGWSEKDEKGLGGALWCCKQAESIAKDENDMDNCWYAENWLKSLKPRSHCVVTKYELNMARKDAYNNALDKIEYSSGEPTFDDGWNAALSFVRKRVAEIEGDEDIIIREEEPIRKNVKKNRNEIHQLEKQGEHNPAWGEEDENIINKILCICNDFKRSFEISPASTKVVQKDIDKIDCWLKSLKDRYSWKPSDEYIEALNVAKDRNDKIGFVLGELYKQLKALKGE